MLDLFSANFREERHHWEVMLVLDLPDSVTPATLAYAVHDVN